MNDPVLAVSNLYFTYPKATAPAIKGLHFQVARGEIFGLLGPSGAGKSTTQKILIGLLTDYQGSAQAFGQEVRAWGSDYYERVGVAFEFPNHYLKLTARENLEYFARLYNGPTESPTTLLELVGLADDADMPVGQYSKGMKNRLSVARSLLHHPELVFMDEPTAGLDPVNARRMQDLIKAEAGRGKTIFLTTHDMGIADELCDRVAFLIDGQIPTLDTPRALKLQYGARRVRVEFGKNGSAQQREFPLEGLGENAEFLTLLKQTPIETIHTQEATLKDIFIRVTGRSLDHNEG